MQNVVRSENPIHSRRQSSFSVAVLAALTFSSVQGAERLDDIEFDAEALKSSGMDPRVAQLFRQAARFLPGEATVAFKVNGTDRGKVKASFDDEGHLCADRDFIKTVRLAPSEKLSDDTQCVDLADAWPQTELRLDAAKQQVELVIPEQYVMALEDERRDWNHGGGAGMLNYDLHHLQSTSASSSLSFTRAGTEAGFNINDWIVRSRQTYSQFNGKNQIQHQAAYAQRSFVESKQVLQAGQISLSNSMFGAGQVYGFQMFPEAALQNDGGGPGLVEGIADSQSVVEIRQSGALVHSTTVPAGPFKLQGFPLLNTRSDLEVTLTGTDGSKRSFIVPASSLLRGRSAVATGLSFGAGRLDQEGSSESPVLATAAMGWQLTPQMSFSAGVLGSMPYRAAAISLDSQMFDNTSLSLQATAMQDNRYGNNGMATTVTLDHNLTERLSVSLNASQQTVGYRELSDALQDEEPDYQGSLRSQIGTGINWSNDDLGGLGVFWSRSDTYKGESTNYLRGSWSRTFSQTYVGLTVEHDTGTSYTQPESRVYLTVSIPFGGGESRRSNLDSYVNHSKSGTRMGSSFRQRWSQDRGFTLSGERDVRTKRTSTTAAADLLTPFSQLNASVSRDSDSNSSWSGRASGAVVAHGNGVTLSPYRVNDTFGIAKVGEESGVKLSTPAGPVWTDGDGYAVLPSLQGFKRSQVQVETKSLPRNVDISNAWLATEAARGSVNHVAFEVVRTRRVMAMVKDSSGKPLQTGASVFDESGNFLTVVDGKGGVFVTDATSVKNLEVQSSGVTLCRFNLSLPEDADTQALYETANAVCR